MTSIGLEGPDVADQSIASVASIYQGGPPLEIGPILPTVVVHGSV